MTSNGVASADLVERIKGWTRDCGFSRVGIATLESSLFAAAFESWIDRGDHAGMTWLERRREVRLNPRLLREWARSAVVVALHYDSPATDKPGSGGDLWPRVARYARGRDYHDVMDEGLRTLESRLQECVPGIRTWRYVDTGPLLERELASRAGLGAFGKHTNLLHPEHGSWFLLGELLLSLELPADGPVAEPCGSCTRCLTACPTGALPAPYRLDARRCISYWTIEHRGPIPPAVRPLLGDWVFGCDLCQEACPWNSLPKGAPEAAFQPPEARADLDLSDLLGLTEARYSELFRGSPMKRARRDGLRRNAATAMGNRRDPRYVEPLAVALTDESPTVRSHAAWALGRIGGQRASAALRKALQAEGDSGVREELTAALAGLPPEARI